MFTKLKKFNKRILFLLMLAFMVLPVWSKPINENTALGVATQKLLHSSGLRSSKDSTVKESLQLLYKSSSSNSGNTNSSMRASQANETVYFYVFGTKNNDGFVIVSGDDRVVPILGYSDTNGFSADDMPPNLQWWLGEYAKQIQFAIDNDIKPTADVTQQWAQYLGADDNGKEE